MERIFSIMQEKLKEIGADSILGAAWAKLKEVGGETIIKTSSEKLKELFLVLHNYGGRFIGWLNEAFPPEARSERLNHLIHLPSQSPFIIIGGLALFVFYLCCSGRPGKTMKAPGQKNHRIRRKDFEANPRSYFRNLHGKKKGK